MSTKRKLITLFCALSALLLLSFAVYKWYKVLDRNNTQAQYYSIDRPKDWSASSAGQFANSSLFDDDADKGYVSGPNMLPVLWIRHIDKDGESIKTLSTSPSLEIIADTFQNPQLSQVISSENITINGKQFLKISYGDLASYDATEYVSYWQKYVIELDKQYVLIANLSGMPAAQFEQEVLASFRVK